MLIEIICIISLKQTILTNLCLYPVSHCFPFTDQYLLYNINHYLTSKISKFHIAVLYVYPTTYRIWLENTHSNVYINNILLQQYFVQIWIIFPFPSQFLLGQKILCKINHWIKINWTTFPGSQHVYGHFDVLHIEIDGVLVELSSPVWKNPPQEHWVITAHDAPRHTTQTAWRR